MTYVGLVSSPPGRRGPAETLPPISARYSYLLVIDEQIVTDTSGSSRRPSCPVASTRLARPATPTLGPIETRPTGHGEGVLVVDDEDALRHLCGRILARHGYRVFTAANGAEAVARYAAHRGEIELVLMDLLMPVMDGAAGIQALRSLNPTLRIVATTGLGSERSATEAATATVQALLAKPVNSGDLLSTVARVLSRNPELPAHDPHGGFCLPSTAQPQ